LEKLYKCIIVKTVTGLSNTVQCFQKLMLLLWHIAEMSLRLIMNMAWLWTVENGVQLML